MRDRQILRNWPDEGAPMSLAATDVSVTVSYSQSKHQDAQSRREKTLRGKLSYTWKRIYRYLSNKDQAGTGAVPVKVFQDALHQHQTFLSREEIDGIVRDYGSEAANPRLVDYNKLSEQLMGIESGSLQHKQFGKMRDTHSTLSRIMESMKKHKQRSEHMEAE